MTREESIISRAAAIAEIEEYIEEYSELEPETGYHNLKWCAMEEAKDVLSMLPAMDAAPVVHGNWIECYERSRHYYCSNCGKVQGIASIVMKYCPECGAKMAEHPWAGRYADQSGAEYADNPTVRSKTFPGIARAMAEQWAGKVNPKE